MKILSIKTLVLLSLCIAFVFKAEAQKKATPFSGVITYEITYPGSELDPATAGQLPTAMTIYVSPEKRKQTMTTSMMTQSTIVDNKEKKMVMLLDVMGQKMAIRSSQEEISKKIEEKGKPKIKVTEETKEIAGYKCRKAEVTADDSETPGIYWFTDEINGDYSNWEQGMDEIKGMLMEYQVTTNNITMKMTAKTIEKKKVKDTEFMVPSDYKEMTADELKKLMGGDE
jgi:GLPGLI family protein